jgi:hypothetical protein
MASQTKEDAVFDEAPPPFWKLFIDKNVAKLKKLKQNDDEIPEELLPLVSPPLTWNEKPGKVLISKATSGSHLIIEWGMIYLEWLH